jgi:DNA modification methylase
MLKLELQDLSALGADLSMLGFTESELTNALRPTSMGQTDEDDIPALQDVAVTRPGDLWLLGEHRLLCGDATDQEAVSAVLAAAKPSLMVTDPPYGVEYDPSWRHRAGVNRSSRVGKVHNDERADWGAAWALYPGDIAYVWHGALHSTTVAESLEREGFGLRAQIIWAKERLVIGRGDYHWQHEPCWYAVRKKGHWTGDRKQTTLWTIPSGGQDTDTEHGTQKPVECMRRPMLNNSEAGELVYDPFLGSGTTLIAAEATGRVCLAIELHPLYVDISVRRWQAFTGRKAMLAGGQASFEEIAAQRVEQPKPPDTINAEGDAHARSTTKAYPHEGADGQPG